MMEQMLKLWMFLMRAKLMEDIEHKDSSPVLTSLGSSPMY